MTERPWRIALADVSINEGERAAVDEVLRSGWLSMGPRTEEFEEAFVRFTGARHALAVANGTVALHLAAAALGLGSGDEVICPSLTFVATAAAIRHTGAAVRLADSCGLDDFSLDPDEIERLLTPRTRAVVVLHYGGYPADMARILASARAHNLLVIEDAAHAIGAELDGRACGTLGDAGCFSFFPNKNMTTGEGGMVVLADDAAAERARKLRSHAMTTLTWDRHRGHAASYDVLDLGFNYRIDELRSALGLVQLGRLAELNTKRKRLAAAYASQLADASGLEVPRFGQRGTSAHHLMAVITPSEAARDRLRARLQQERIQTSVHYPAIHRFSHYRRSAERLPRAEAIAERVITLPLHPNLDTDDVERVCSTLTAEPI